MHYMLLCGAAESTTHRIENNYIRTKNEMGIREIRKNERRRAILDAARTLIQERHKEGFSMPVLAEKAGVSLVTPYNLFGSKSHILLEVVREEIFARAKEMDTLPYENLVTWISELSHTLARVFYTKRYFYRSVIEAVVAQGSPEGQNEIMELSYGLYIPWIERLVAEKKLQPVVSASMLARHLTYIISGAMQIHVMGRSTESRLRFSMERALLVVLAGFCLPEERGALHARLKELDVA